ncbi:MAG TPA: hypothetical protein VM639_23685 [Dongiaceae bacterium]|nr:hypothetical protein [Dongiaceae bacterium]
MLSYDPRPDCTREYVEDVDGKLLFCRDYDDEMFWQLAREASRLLIRLPEEVSDEVHPSIRKLGQLVQHMVIANTKVPECRDSLDVPTVHELSAARRAVLAEASRRALAGFDNDGSGGLILVLCCVPEAICDCELTLRL